MEAKELGQILNEVYTNARKGEQVTMIHLFGVMYSGEITRCGIKEVVKESGIRSTYLTEVAKAVKLAKYVRPI